MLMRALIVLFSTLLAVGCSNPRTIDSLTPTSPSSQPAHRTASQLNAAPTPIEDGREIFLANCVGCHGKNADGDTPAGRNWHVPDLRSPQVQSLADPVLRQILREGKGKMPAWGGLLSQTDMDHVLAYVRSLKRP
jgi:mono/diheme cytochrome c family protein